MATFPPKKGNGYIFIYNTTTNRSAEATIQ